MLLLMEMKPNTLWERKCPTDASNHAWLRPPLFLQWKEVDTCRRRLQLPPNNVSNRYVASSPLVPTGRFNCNIIYSHVSRFKPDDLIQRRSVSSDRAVDIAQKTKYATAPPTYHPHSSKGQDDPTYRLTTPFPPQCTNVVATVAPDQTARTCTTISNPDVDVAAVLAEEACPPTKPTPILWKTKTTTA